MIDPKKYSEVADKVNRGVSGEGWSRVRNSSHTEGLGEFMTRIVLAVGLRPIEHIDATASFDHDKGFAGRAVVFTKETVVLATAVGASAANNDVSTEVDVYPRAGIKRIGVYGGESMFNRDPFDDWPGNFQICVEWKHGAQVVLPMRRSDFPSHRENFATLYEKLLSEIGD